MNFDDVLSWAEQRRFVDTYIGEDGMSRSKLVNHPESSTFAAKAEKGELDIKRLVDGGVEWLDVSR